MEETPRINPRRLYFPHKIQYDGKPLGKCTKQELITALCSAVQEIQDLKTLTQKQENLLYFTLEMWRVKDAKKECSCDPQAKVSALLKYLESAGI